MPGRVGFTQDHREPVTRFVQVWIDFKCLFETFASGGGILAVWVSRSQTQPRVGVVGIDPIDHGEVFVGLGPSANAKIENSEAVMRIRVVGIALQNRTKNVLGALHVLRQSLVAGGLLVE